MLRVQDSCLSDNPEIETAVAPAAGLGNLNFATASCTISFLSVTRRQHRPHYVGELLGAWQFPF